MTSYRRGRWAWAVCCVIGFAYSFFWQHEGSFFGTLGATFLLWAVGHLFFMYRYHTSDER